MPQKTIRNKSPLARNFRGLHAWRAGRIITMAGEEAATGSALFRPLAALENGVILAADGEIAAIGPREAIALPKGCITHDLGDGATLIPAPVNAHCHLQLSHLAGKTLWGKGFAAWLESLVPLILAERKNPTGERESACLLACENALEGASLIADTAGPSPADLALVRKCARKAGLGLLQFHEHFGFNAPGADLARQYPDPHPAQEDQAAAPTGHALYSTSPQTLRLARNAGRRRDLPFSLHLAESPEELEQLLKNSGPLAEYYHKCGVLPENWRAPGLRPLSFARRLGLLGPGFLAVHGVWLEDAEMRALARSGGALCLCPRSNANLGVGRADLGRLIASGVLLALGTDGLVSNADVNVINEALFLRGAAPDEALIRMLTVNGAKALALPPPRLEAGRPADFRVWPA